MTLPEYLASPAHEYAFVGHENVIEQQPSLGDARVRHFHVRGFLQFPFVAGVPGFHDGQAFDIPGDYAGQGIVLVRLLVAAARQQENLLGSRRTADHQLGPANDDTVFAHFFDMQVGVRVMPAGKAFYCGRPWHPSTRPKRSGPLSGHAESSFSSVPYSSCHIPHPCLR